ncbi:efflux RND transporter periplasmic adaptor subunit [Parvibaculum sp.]|jgi:membrane fusion protein (multidrug efflux system)|uniref:efflux RND transporter periplasmic adaptor subunit n=1 Tax=Parvibaculum sp. TaxID=2024848 RepID=UPI001B1CAC9E|nr:efflux RND transporter periplasmic adaptor subunit [Parvibaculum sp.]MBO6633944.1 efflux RND transporter periplasmic adaptor subunit [Parvibaculum sp.]MBO6677798.1 efflux RND transporter periplasmic adaptor subunit [Parvibaculum sp.]MBO6684184.1 efflux RND transporter periplasmic adaptor subunit [Parvibaculum sp.]MBO6903567.1 efflux RND transporter periplasmic adaptor subunit [Parvibaculum sp.]
MHRLVLALAASICFSAPAWAQETSQNVIVARAVADRFVDPVEALGTTFSNESVVITASVSDKVTEILFEDGQTVEEDALLVALRRDEQRAALAAAEAVLAERRTAYQRAKELESRQYTTTAQLEERLAALREAEANRDAAAARLADREIRAPFEGVVGLRNISVGTLVTPGDTITTLDDLDPIKLDFTVPAAYLSTIRPGLEIVATTTALPDIEFRGEVNSVSTQVDRITRSITARALIANPDHALKPGLLMTVQLLKNPRSAIVIPEEALVPLGETNFVFLAENDVAIRREVEIGARRPGDVEILSGVREGDLVVTHGTMRLRDGQAINIVKEQKADRTIGRLIDETSTVR